MSILIIAATEKEIAPFVNQSPEVEVLITGVGIAATVYQLTKYFSASRPELVIQAGIAGCFAGNEKLMEQVVVVDKDCFADAGARQQNTLLSLADMNLADGNAFPYTDGYIANPDKKLLAQFALPIVDAITVCKITDNEVEIAMLRTRYPCAIESMEGACLHYVCAQEKVPFLQLRAISNVVGQRNKEHWRMKEAIENLNKELIKIIDIIS